MPWDQQKKDEQINGDRRRDRRYQIPLELRWKLIRRRRVLFTGEGRTLDLSSGGLLVDAGRPLPAGLNIEISVAWPVLLREATPMQLVIAGKIVRSHGNLTGIRMMQHEFRTAGSEIRRTVGTAPSLLSSESPLRFPMLH